MRKLIIVFIFLLELICLQSCFISHFGNSPTWFYSNNSIDAIPNQNTSIDPDLRISISKNPKQIYIPFLIITWDVKDYYVDWNFHTENSYWKSIDSLDYKIYNSSDSLLYIGKRQKEQYFSIVGDIGNYRAYFNSENNIKISKKEDTLKIELIVFLKKDNGEQITNTYSYKLKKNRHRWFQIGFFQV